ncbi:hypothetical protein F2P56_001355 [Juglans regia]|uniref:Uncharacterized protein n=1 Tax=Juglans regia TaxID=51240 RepID=A0A833YDK1_JUGRE|nr:hypothetical protein F2P56_001355 [Juglans regia]
MQFQIPRLRNLSMIKKNSLISSAAPTHFSSFLSTPTLCHKWKNKGKSFSIQSYIRYAVHQKRADTKRVLKDLFKSGSSKLWAIEKVKVISEVMMAISHYRFGCLRMMRVHMGTHSSAEEIILQYFPISAEITIMHAKPLEGIMIGGLLMVGARRGVTTHYVVTEFAV